jgi:hypothetical protein
VLARDAPDRAGTVAGGGDDVAQLLLGQRPRVAGIAQALELVVSRTATDEIDDLTVPPGRRTRAISATAAAGSAIGEARTGR